jgi:hypothetical protein
MQNAQEAIAAMQEQALDAIKSGQSTTLEAVKNWSDTVNKVTSDKVPAPAVPDEVKFIGDPKEIIDSVYDFAGKVLELNKQFVRDLLDVTKSDK